MGKIVKNISPEELAILKVCYTVNITSSDEDRKIYNCEIEPKSTVINAKDVTEDQLNEYKKYYNVIKINDKQYELNTYNQDDIEYLYDKYGEEKIEVTVNKLLKNKIISSVNASTVLNVYDNHALKSALDKLTEGRLGVVVPGSAVDETISEVYDDTKIDTTNKTISGTAGEYSDFLNNNQTYTKDTTYVELSNGINKAYTQHTDVKGKTAATYSGESYPNANIGTEILANNINANANYTSWDDVVNSLQNFRTSTFIDSTGTVINTTLSALINNVESLNEFWGQLDTSDNNIMQVLSSIGNSLTGILQTGLAAINTYNDGSTETAYGTRQESTWRSLVSAIQSNAFNYKITQLKTTPLDSGDNNIYGKMILGVPPTFSDRTDPRNRVMINTFVKDARYLSLTPGLPKFNGSRYIASGNNDITKQTNSPKEMIDYLTKNGVDASNLSKDKRYYTFSPAYGKFYSYLETMLNAIWIKLGLGTTDEGFSLYTFFNDLQDSTSDGADPLSQYKSAIGFFVDPTGAVAENISHGKTSFGASLADESNSKADEYSKINFLTGMGSGGTIRNTMRSVAMGLSFAKNVKNFVLEAASETIGTAKSFFQRGGNWASKALMGVVGAGIGAVKDVYRNTTQVDLGAQMQSFATTNGMHVVYPDLWADGGGYSKSMTFDFNFTSPYGDPLSIFKYVYVPFCTLLCFTMPRAADDNGYVSPFFVRADMPGLFTCDLGLISNISYTRGGPNGLFTKDGLPRAISGNFSIEDLYPYLAMSRRISFLSANPSYTSFLDTFTGFNAVYTTNDTSEINSYWRNMLNRVNGEHKYTLWNKFDSDGRRANYLAANTVTESNFTVKPKSINWFRKT